MEFPMLMPLPGQGTPMPPPPPGLLGAMPNIDPQKAGLLAAAFRGLQASGPSRMPVSLGQTIGQAGEAGMGAQRQAMNDQLHQSQVGMQQQMMGMQFQQAQEAMRMKQQQQAQIQAYAQTLPEAQRVEFMADPQGFLNRSKPQVLGRSLVKSDGSVIATDQTWQEEQKAAREQRMQELEMRLQDSRLQAADRAALQRELAAQRMESARQNRELAASMRQPPAPQIIQTDSGPMQAGRDGVATPILDSRTMQPVVPKSTDKALPTSAAQKLMENQQNLRKAQEALRLLNGESVGGVAGDQNATGKKAMLSTLGVPGDYILNAIDPSGVNTRAAVGDLGSMVIHDRSGAAVTASEFPRLRPFIPLATDSPEVAKKKTARFVKEYEAVVQEAADFYRQSGYKVPDNALRSNAGSSGEWSVVR